MKAGFISAAALGLANFAVAQPHALRHVHRRDQVVVQTVTDYQTVEREEIVVYMDQDEKPVATSTFWSGVVATSAPAPSTVAAAFHQVETSAAPAPPAPASSKPAPANSPAPAPSSSGSNSGSNSGSSSGSSSGSPPSGSGFGHGLSYSPYQAGGGCKSASEVKSDLDRVLNGAEVVRLYGTDCSQVENVLQALSGKSTRIMAGVFDIGSLQSELSIIANAVKSHAGGNWNVIQAVTIGNELVNSGKADAGSVSSAVSSAKSTLKGLGYNGAVATVDTMIAYKNNPSLASTSDFVGMNCHAFFDGNTEASGAGQFVKGWIEQISAAAGKTVVVTESGWPHSGSTNGKAVPSPENQKAAISSLKNTISNNMILYTALDDLWKTNNANTFNAETAWGMYSSN